MSVMADDSGGSGGELTLAFSLSAARRLADPPAVFADAGEWSQYLGVVGNDHRAVATFVADHDLRQDFELGERDKWLALEEIRAQTPTPRHVLVGTDVDDRRAADHLGWEFLAVPEAARKADWDLDDGADGAGTSGFGALLERVWPF